MWALAQERNSRAATVGLKPGASLTVLFSIQLKLEAAIERKHFCICVASWQIGPQLRLTEVIAKWKKVRLSPCNIKRGTPPQNYGYPEGGVRSREGHNYFFITC